ncbi:MAG: PAS domain S-box protein [Acidimicrobiales bacterium]
MTSGPEGDPGQLLGAIFSASPDGVVVIDKSGTVVLSSPAITSLFGYSPEELVGASVETLLPLDRRAIHAEHITHFFEAPHPRQMGAGLELAGRNRDGVDFPVDVSLAPVRVRGQVYVAAFVRDASERQRAVERLNAVNEITQQLLSGASAGEIFPIVAARARHLNRSDAVWIVLPSRGGSGELEIASVDGPSTEILLGFTLSPESSRSAGVMRTGRSDVIDDLSRATNVPPQCASLDLGPGLYAPLVAKENRLGALVFGRVHGAPAFSPLDIAFAEVFASAIATAIELGDARHEIDQLGIVAEEERIARDLHDTVIQQLFAIGMSLQATRGSVPGAPGERIDAAVDNLDDVIKEIRNTIFRLPGRETAIGGLRDEMLRIAGRYGEELGFIPRVGFDGPVDVAVPDVVIEQLLHVFGEAMSNIARHARATSAESVVTVADGFVTLSVTDDGEGITDEPSAGNGLRNIERRATDLGGTSSVRRRDPRGTIIEWRVPV